MTKRALNQNAKYANELLNYIEPDFIFSNEPINRSQIVSKNNVNADHNKISKILELKEKINSIENCILKDNSKNLVMGDGDFNSQIMLIGETPGVIF